MVTLAIPKPVFRASVLLGGLLYMLLAGFWAFGKAFAYVGRYPVYIGELALLLGILLTLARGRFYLLRHPSFGIFWGFFLLAMLQGLVSILFLKQPPLEVIRNLSVVYYGLFAYVAYGYVVQFSNDEGSIPRVMSDVLPRMMPWVLIGVCLSWVGGGMLEWGGLPTFPGTEVPILTYKSSDAIMPLIVVFALWVRGYLSTWWLSLSMFPVVAAAAMSRSVMIGYLATVAFYLRPSKRYVRMIGAVSALIVIFFVSGVRIELNYREISAEQYLANVQTLFASQDDSSFNTSGVANKKWRLAWWGQIQEDAIQHQRVLLGLGWGINLANHFGYQTSEHGQSMNALRHPHNVFMGLLGRGGWLLSLLWAAFYGSLILGLLQAYRWLQESPKRDLAALLCVYLFASVVNGLTDVFLESPQAAIPHWIGIGIAWGLIREVQLSRPGRPFA